MDVQKKLDEIVTLVAGARAMPMSASCVINRAGLLALLDEVRDALPGSLARAEELIGDRDQVVTRAREEADRIIGAAHAERGSLVSDTEVARRSRAEADRMLAEAREEAEAIRAEADEYVDSKLANFEVVLTKTLGSVGRGRERLLGGDLPSTGGGNLDSEDDYPRRGQDPESGRQDADAYVDAKLGAFESVLTATLEAVGRGREKLHGRIATDDLGALAEESSPSRYSSDADYLADLAAPADTPADRGATVPAPRAQEPGEGYSHTPVPAPRVRMSRTEDYAEPPTPVSPGAPEPYGYGPGYAAYADGRSAEPYGGYQGYGDGVGGYGVAAYDPAAPGDARGGYPDTDPYGTAEVGPEQPIRYDPPYDEGGR
ncbi:cell division initiation protein [Streptomyces sp. WMMC905]|uniref:cell division initiation protein n=1 Tax=Streptomyces sp. WMMC905 TaxID=3404123 RepID=UPI003B926269